MSENIKQIGRGVWKIRYNDPMSIQPGKIRKQRSENITGTKEDAKARLAEITDKISKGTLVPSSGLTVNEWLDRWLKMCEGSVSKVTHIRYTQLLNVHIKPKLGHLKLQELQALHIQEHYTYLRKEGKKPAFRNWKDPAKPQPEPTEKKGLAERSVLHVHRTLKPALENAVRMGFLYRNPCGLVTAPRTSSSASVSVDDDAPEKMTVLDQSQLASLLKGLRGHKLSPLSTLTAGTGLRRGEVAALKWADVNLEEGTVRINKALEEANGIRIKPPKNKSSRRTIGIGSDLVSFLRTYKTLQKETGMQLGYRLSPDSIVFPASPSEPSKYIRPDYITKTFSKKAAGLGFPGLSFHDLRHTFITHLLTEGVPPNTVSKIAGHSSTKMTLDTYGHVLPQTEERAIKAAGSLLSAALAD